MNAKASVLMMPLSTVYEAVTKARLLAYQKGIFKTERLPATVISVGNITSGGTGKTPLVEWICHTLASELKSEGVCVLTRGYGRIDPDKQVVVSDGKMILADDRTAGDEALLLAQNLRGFAAVVANANRVDAGHWAITNLGSTVFVLDDGFQHLRLARDFDIVTVDATNPWSDGGMLPSGLMRESPTALSRANCVVVTRTDQASDVAKLEIELKTLTGAPTFRSRMVTARIRTIEGSTVDNSEAPSQRVAAFCGVGNPQSFFTHLELNNFQIGARRIYPDHHRYTQKDLDDLLTVARSASCDAFVTTAKDAIKLTQLHLPMTCYVVDTRIEIEDGLRLVEMLRQVVER